MITITQKMIDEAKKNVGTKHSRYVELSALEKHVYAFGSFDSKNNINYSSTTIANELSHHGEPHYNIVGSAVSFFNATHSGKVPYGDITFSCPHQKEFGASLHLGTLRLYGEDGSFSQDNWDGFAKDNDNISLHQLMDYLEDKTGMLPDEHDTGRNTDSWFSSRKVQTTAGREAWKEVFKILACDWQEGKDKTLEPLVQTNLLELFFKDSLACLELAKQLKLPVAAPDTLNETMTYSQ
jgi:hypothetical protein